MLPARWLMALIYNREVTLNIAWQNLHGWIGFYSFSMRYPFPYL